MLRRLLLIAMVCSLALAQTWREKAYQEIVRLVGELYVDPDFDGRDWKAMAARYEPKPGLSKADFYASMKKLIVELGDEHSRLLTPEEVTDSELRMLGDSNAVGIGVLMVPVPERHIAVLLTVMPGSPAEAAGLKSHDAILAVDGEPLVANGQMRKAQGPEGSTVTLQVRSPGQQAREVRVTRRRVPAAWPVEAHLLPGSRKIGYLFIPTFFEQPTVGKVRRALEDFGPLDGLILDFRANSGGTNTVAVPILGFFMEGRAGAYVSRSGRRALNVKGSFVHNSSQVPLVVLVGPNTVSFGEIAAGILQDQGRARVVGAPSAGNVEALHVHRLPGGGELWLAEERFEPAIHPTTRWEGRGVLPDVEAEAPWESFTFETDPAIAAAVKLLTP